ncbi:MAG: cupin domain-containing protein [Candidatus Aminicenantes bacterium]|nr:cupin domain-containing protein [Candidatus Aminicenantes bacterium]
MIVKKFSEIEKTAITKEGLKGVSIRWLIGPDSGAPNFYLRLFEVEPGGHSPFHSHPWEHEVYILEGKGKLNTGKESIPFEKDYFILVLPGEEHQFENTGATALKFLCIIPPEGK